MQSGTRIRTCPLASFGPRNLATPPRRIFAAIPNQDHGLSRGLGASFTFCRLAGSVCDGRLSSILQQLCWRMSVNRPPNHTEELCKVKNISNTVIYSNKSQIYQQYCPESPVISSTLLIFDNLYSKATVLQFVNYLGWPSVVSKDSRDGFYRQSVVFQQRGISTLAFTAAVRRPQVRGHFAKAVERRF
jgi:hypothetical protein